MASSDSESEPDHQSGQEPEISDQEDEDSEFDIVDYQSLPEEEPSTSFQDACINFIETFSKPRTPVKAAQPPEDNLLGPD